MSGVSVPLVLAGVAIFGTMAIEAVISARRARDLRARGAFEPSGDVYGWMQAAYPGLFVLILAEGWWRGPEPSLWQVAGVLLWTAAKGLKVWVIAALGARWSFRILVPSGLPLVAGGPYRWCRHPNYAAVLGEYAGAALALVAPVSGAVSFIVMGLLLRRRIDVEERALGLR